MNTIISLCPFCGGTVTQKSVLETVFGGGHTASIQMNILVCEKCSERFYSLEQNNRLEALQAKLENQQTEGLQPTGVSFKVV